MNGKDIMNATNNVTLIGTKNGATTSVAIILTPGGSAEIRGSAKIL